jgi:VWFA-related protein
VSLWPPGLVGDGQSSTASTSRQAPQPPVIRSTTHLVQVTVVVQDEKGNSISGLREEDFAIFDQGRKQDVAVFTAKDSDEMRAAHVFPANVFTNRYNLREHDPGNVTVVLFDALNTSSKEKSQVRRQVLRFFRTLKPQDHVAIYALTRELLILHDLTEDSASLV